MGLLDGIGNSFSGIGNSITGMLHGHDAPPPDGVAGAPTTAAAPAADATAPATAAPPPPPQDSSSVEHGSWWDNITHAVGDAAHAMGDFAHTVGDDIGHGAVGAWDATVSAFVATDHAIAAATNWVGTRVAAGAGDARDGTAMMLADWLANLGGAKSESSVVTPHGKHVQVEQTKSETAFGTVYHVKIDGVEHKITLGTGVPDPEQKVAQAIKYLADLPPKVEKTVKNIEVFPGNDPDDAVYAQNFGLSSFDTAGTGGSGATIRLYHGNVDGGVIYHEGAHNFADEAFGNADPKKTSTDDANGKAWDDAVKADIELAKTSGDSKDWAGYATPYAKTVRDAPPCSDGEDFAESFKVYLQAAQDDPAALAKFKKDFPNRAKTLDTLFASQIDDAKAAAAAAAAAEAAAALAAAKAATASATAATPPAHA